MSTINAFLQRRKEEKEGPKKQATNGQKPYITKEEKKKKFFAPKADKESFRVIVPASSITEATPQGKHYEEAYFHEFSGDGGLPQQYYCLNHNDGKPCPLCEKREALKKQAFTNPKGSQEQKDLLKASNAYEPRRFYIFKGISRGHLSDGVKFWRIKQNYKQTGAMDKIESEVADYVEVNGEKDFADAYTGADFQIKTVEQPKTMGGGTYREITTIKLVGPKALAEDEAEIAKLVEDSMTWKDVYTPIAINGHLDEYQFLQAVVDGRAPFWDKVQSKWILTSESGEQYAAEYSKPAEEGGNGEASVAQTVAPEVEAPVAPAKKVAAKKAPVAADEDSDLPF